MEWSNPVNEEALSSKGNNHEESKHDDSQNEDIEASQQDDGETIPHPRANTAS